MPFMNMKFAHVNRLAIGENIRLPAKCFARTLSITLRRRALCARLRGLTCTAVPRGPFRVKGGGRPLTVRPWVGRIGIIDRWGRED